MNKVINILPQKQVATVNPNWEDYFNIKQPGPIGCAYISYMTLPELKLREKLNLNVILRVAKI